MKPDETAFSISEVVEKTIENAEQQGHLQNGNRPKFVSDNEPGFTSKILAGYLNVSPRDIFAGRKEEILQKRAKKVLDTFQRRPDPSFPLFKHCTYTIFQGLKIS